MPVETTFLVCGRATKRSPASQEKGLTANSLQRKTGTAPETTEQKNPQLLVIGDCIMLYFHGLKKWWQKRNYSLQQPIGR
jgi:hypothetical protein